MDFWGSGTLLIDMWKHQVRWDKRINESQCPKNNYGSHHRKQKLQWNEGMKQMENGRTQKIILNLIVIGLHKWGRPQAMWEEKN